MSIEEPVWMRRAYDGIAVVLPDGPSELGRQLSHKKTSLDIIRDQVIYYAYEISRLEVLTGMYRRAGVDYRILLDEAERNRAKLHDFIALAIAREAEIKALERSIPARVASQERDAGL